MNRTKPARKLLEGALDVHPDAWLPALATQRFRSERRSTARRRRSTNGERTPGKVAIFATCYVNYNEPGIGHDLLKVLEHNEIPYELVEKESCCGMPKLELGDLESASPAQGGQHPGARAVRAARAGRSSPRCRRCTLMFKQELPLMFPDDADVQARAGGDVRSRSSTSSRATRTAC